MDADYYKNYWKTHPEKYEEHKRKVREYKKNARSKGKIKSDIDFNKNHPNYLKVYMVEKRSKAKAEGMCTKCFKRKSKEGSVACEPCLKQSLECTKKWLKNKKEV